MEDLENERAVVAKQLRLLNFEPVNAENMLPTGVSSWEQIYEELQTCHVFVLLIGARYGWIPTSGPLSQQNISVTHGEFQAAQSLGLPVLPFFKALRERNARQSREGKRRDAFRREVEDWGRGRFRGVFRNVIDLAEIVGAAVVQMLSDNFQRDQLRTRRMYATELTSPVPVPEEVILPLQLTKSVAEGRAVLCVGAGMSIGAGLPAVNELAAVLKRLKSPDPVPNLRQILNGVWTGYGQN